MAKVELFDLLPGESVPRQISFEFETEKCEVLGNIKWVASANPFYKDCERAMLTRYVRWGDLVWQVHIFECSVWRGPDGVFRPRRTYLHWAGSEVVNCADWWRLTGR